jgi:death on curing protein
MRYLTAEEVLVLHALVIDETGGSHGVRDTALLQSLVQKPQSVFGGDDLYPDLFTKAAVLCEAVTNYHVFVDGNKRTALISASRFLACNGYELSAGNDDVEAVMLSVAKKELDVAGLAAWFEKNTTPLRKPHGKRKNIR